ncbi:MAG: acyl-CoA dehydrogenase family protein [Devosia sp.]
MTYRARVDEMVFALETVAGLAKAREAGVGAHFSADDTRAILTEVGRFAEDKLAPLNAVGDHEHARLENGHVTTPTGWKEAYGAWVEAGWGSLTGDPEYGGQGLPMALQVAAADVWNQANASFAINPILTVSAVEVLQIYGTEAQKSTYLPKLISGEWSGTMNLTEPHAGSDLSTLKTRAEPDGEHFRLFGQKIYITYGEHDLTANIIHMVLARMAGAPEGTHGLSLFLVPKILVGEDGELGEPNDLQCVGVEKKLGLHGSPTCTMVYGAKGEGALGYLVGAPHQGLSTMFTMMNNARVQVGIQGAAIAERAFQHALSYALERRQGRASGWQEAGMAPIVHHPDVKRMLLTMKAFTEAARAICYACAVAIDRSHGEGPDAAFWHGRADLLTPIAKAFATDTGTEVASIGVQVHGGMGYIEETGAAQHYRDARIFQIYEGTNGIQSIDLLRRKLTAQDGAVLAAYLKELADIAEDARGSNAIALSDAGHILTEAVAAVEGAASRLTRMLADGESDTALAGATAFMRAMGLTAGGAYLCKAALAAANGEIGDRANLARFFCSSQVASVTFLAGAAVNSGPSVNVPVDAIAH